VVGVGWEGSAEPANFMPHLAAAHARFPDEAPLAFPAPDRRYGVQNVWVEALSDLGVVGFALWTSLFAAGLWRAARSCDRPGIRGRHCSASSGSRCSCGCGPGRASSQEFRSTRSPGWPGVAGEIERHNTIFREFGRTMAAWHLASS